MTSQTGFDVTPQNPESSDLWAKYSRKQLEEADCIFAWAERNWYDIFDQSKFKHRRINRTLYGMYYRDYAVNGSGHSVIISYPHRPDTQRRSSRRVYQPGRLGDLASPIQLPQVMRSFQ